MSQSTASLAPTTPVAKLPQSSSHKLTIAAPTLQTQYLKSLVHIDLELLPPSARDFVRAIGEADALTLIRHAGGTLVYVPIKANEDHALAQLMTGRGWTKFCAIYGAQRIQIPKCTHALMQLRNARMVADADLQYKETGKINYNELVIRYGLSHRVCEKIVNKASHEGLDAFVKKGNADSRTLDLF
jgi:hypothetical protein